MPEQLITHKIRLGLSECAERRGETLADDFYVTVSIGDEGPEGPQRICTLRELLMEEAKLSGCLENELRLPPQIARFRGVAKHADDAALHVHREYQTWGGENESRPDPRKFVGRDKVIWDAMLSAGRQALLEHGLTVSEETLADAYYAMIKRGDKEIMKHAD